MNKFLIVLVASVSLAGAGCSKKSELRGGTIDIPAGNSAVTQLSNGAEIVVYNIGGTNFFEVEGILAEESFIKLKASVSAKPGVERDAILGRELGKVIAKLKGVKAISLEQYPEIGYFTLLLPYRADSVLGEARSLSFAHKVLLNPVVHQSGVIRAIKSHTPQDEGLIARPNAPRTDTSGFSGLERIGAPAFVKLAESEIGGGARVDGSSVNVGITDTGITYNHPTFLNRDRTRNRITYMRDFTREGRVYFNLKAKIETAPVEDGSEEDLAVKAEVIATPRIPSIPAGDDFIKIEGLKIKVTAELRAILTAPETPARLGVLLEDSLQAPGEAVDLNGNGTVNDKLFIVLVPGATPAADVIYVADETGDFRDSKPVRNWNTSHDLVTLFAERAGFDLRVDKLPAADGKSEVEVRSASIVGYDPGNHGSHVAGIAAGSRTISNDDELTLARGVAPEAKILMNRVCANNGGCNATAAFIDLVLKGGADVVNMSLGGLNPFNDGYGVQETTINRLTLLKNALFVISAGNSGPGHQTIGSPSTARLSLSVGASASKKLIQRQYQWPGGGILADGQPDEDMMLFFSSRGPTAAGGFKPNLSAPGTELSSIQLNAAPGSRSGLDVYWGTSMAAPTATGAYALFLDAVRKYNAANPSKALATDVLTLRQVLIASARPFDVSSYEPVTGARTLGQYTWVDEGTGIIDLPAAWKKLIELRDSAVPSAVKIGDAAVELDYSILVESKRQPNGIAYDGTRKGSDDLPAFGTGLYIDFHSAETLRQVNISRRLTEAAAASPEAGELHRQLATTADEFTLKTVYFGSDVAWLKAGALDELNCATSPTANLTVLGRGVEVDMKSDGTGTLVPIAASTLNICLDREAITTRLPAGDNGALIYAYRTKGGKVNPLPSFIVPVYVTVPHRTLAGSASLETSAKVASFGVSRNYVVVPKGTSVLRIELELPALKKLANGLAAPGQDCSGVEAMFLEGTNVAKTHTARADARIFNCTADGAPAADGARRLVVNRTNPTPGVWDLHVFGSYKYASSDFKLSVNYVTAQSSVKRIEGGLAALTGSLEWKVIESSMSVQPDGTKSTLELDGLSATTASKVAKEEHVIVEGPLGRFRAYPEGVKTVTITTGGSSGNDIDLIVLECEAGTTDEEECKSAGVSGGSSDVEKVTFKPKAGMTYAVRVDGFDIADDGDFTSGETLGFAAEGGVVGVIGGDGKFSVSYGFTEAQLAASKLLANELFTGGKYAAVGALTLRSSDEVVLDGIAVRIQK